MPLFTFNTGIPASGNNPSADQPEMLINNISADGFAGTDHYGYNTGLGGYHKAAHFVSIPGQPPGVPPGVIDTAMLYGGKQSGEDQLWFSNGISNQGYQLTRTNTGVYANFGKVLSYATSGPLDFIGGWTFLPGNLLLQYGVVTGFTPNSFATITLPTSFFSTSYFIQATPKGSGSVVQTAQAAVVSQTQFNLALFSPVGGDVFWMAVGF